MPAQQLQLTSAIVVNDTSVEVVELIMDFPI
jgi:hypothetical protein